MGAVHDRSRLGWDLHDTWYDCDRGDHVAEEESFHDFEVAINIKWIYSQTHLNRVLLLPYAVPHKHMPRISKSFNALLGFPA